MLIDVMGTVDPKSATTRTGDVTELMAGEIILAFCAKLLVATRTNVTKAILRFMNGTRTLQFVQQHARVGTVTLRTRKNLLVMR
jgi:hypothetical protein